MNSTQKKEASLTKELSVSLSQYLPGWLMREGLSTRIQTNVKLAKQISVQRMEE